MPGGIRMIVSMAVVLGLVQCASAQYKSYSDYYRQNPGVRTQAPGTNAYLYDKYFYHSPGVSPYLNLGRGGNDAADSYHLYVKPELERRRANTVAQAQYVQQRKLQGNVGHTQYPGAAWVGGSPANSLPKPVQPGARKSPAYYNHWYGGWNNR